VPVTVTVDGPDEPQPATVMMVAAMTVAAIFFSCFLPPWWDVQDADPDDS
jgi:hypothetical protein